MESDLMVNTPDSKNKRSIEEIISPSDGPQGSHINSPNPIRRKGSLPDMTSYETKTTDAPLYMQGKTYNVIELVKNAVCSSEFLVYGSH